jgi:hypothetical protein
MDTQQEFHYRLPGRIAGQRPGSHPGLTVGAGQEFVTHMSLYDRPDPRRLDLRASLRTLREDWLVRVSRQRAGIAVRAIVDVSASMSFGGRRPKLHVVADFIESLGLSAFRVGDAVGMTAFDELERPDLFIPARLSRGIGSIMAAALRACARQPLHHRPGDRSDVDGLEEAAAPLAGQQGLVFLVSDFHWQLQRLNRALDLLAHASVVPLVVWDPAETQPPERNALATLRDSESGARLTLWVRPRLREEWRRAVTQRRSEIDSCFAARGLRPFYIDGRFDADALSRYFLEAQA